MNVKNILAVGFIILAAVIAACSNSRNTKTDQSMDSVSVRDLIRAQNFVFIPRYVIPMTGRRRELTEGYELSISKDSLISYLPFFGRGYTAPISPSDVDFDFTSVNFTYTVTPGNGWKISIKPRDQMYLQEMFLRIFENGSASLNIISINRSSISYDGQIARRIMKSAKRK